MNAYETDQIDQTVLEILQNNGVGILLTDTIYGIVGRLNQEAINRINQLKNRPDGKSYIVLCTSAQLKDFKIDVEAKKRAIKVWSEATSPTSIVLPVESEFAREDQTMAIRVPKSEQLLQLLESTGPLVAPSANPHSLPPADTTKKAQAYFNDSVDFYINGGKPAKKASSLVAINTDGSVHVLR